MADLQHSFSETNSYVDSLGLPDVNFTCPKRAGYDFRNISSLPNRIFNPPAIVKSSSSLGQNNKSSEKSEKETTFGKVRRFTQTPMCQVKLEDVLDGQHLPPLTLNEFEDYLIHVQFAVEKLYFYFWLKDYTSKYAQWQSDLAKKSGRASEHLKNETDKDIEDDHKYSTMRTLSGKTLRHSESNEKKTIGRELEAPDSIGVNCLSYSPTELPLPAELEASFEFALGTFLPSLQTKKDWTPGRDLELNLSSATKKKFREKIRNSKAPFAFDLIRKEVMEMLNDSMKCWLSKSSGNADSNRVWFALSLGAFCIAAAITASIFIMIKASSPLVSLSSTPMFWLGVAVFVSGLYQTCPVIFLFGAYRQIHVWELLRAKDGTEINPGTFDSPFSSSYPPQTLDSPSQAIDDHLKNGNAGAQNKNSLQPAGSTFPLKEKHDMHQGEDQMKISSETKHSNNEYGENGTSFLYRRLSSIKKSTKKLSPGVFGPVTEVISPIVVRAQRSNILKAFSWAFLGAIIWMVIWGVISSKAK